jgi:hypothetical protein
VELGDAGIGQAVGRLAALAREGRIEKQGTGVYRAKPPEAV